VPCSHRAPRPPSRSFENSGSAVGTGFSMEVRMNGPPRPVRRGVRGALCVPAFASILALSAIALAEDPKVPVPELPALPPAASSSAAAAPSPSAQRPLPARPLPAPQRPLPRRRRPPRMSISSCPRFPRIPPPRNPGARRVHPAPAPVARPRPGQTRPLPPRPARLSRLPRSCRRLRRLSWRIQISRR
jgi:hypothetical protein